MGEYAYRKEDNAHIKIGTCESMYYIRYEDRNKVKKDKFSLDCSKETGLYWRLPFTDEDGIKPGDYEHFNRGLLLPGFNFDEPEKAEPGLIQLRHEQSGLMLNVSCFHGSDKLPEESKDISPSWNGKKSNAFKLISIKNTPTEIRYVVRCRFCESMWSYELKDIIDYVKDPIIKKRLTAYRIEAEVK